MKTRILSFDNLSAEQLKSVGQALSRGAVAALATDTVYGLATGAFCEEAIQCIYALKERPITMPLQLLVGSVAQAQEIACLDEAVQRIANACWPGGLTLIVPPNQAGQALLRGFSGLGIRVPAYAALQRMLGWLNVPLACTSANVHGRPVLTQEADVIKQFEGRVDFILTNGTLSPIASTVLDVTVRPPHLLRAGTISREELAHLYQGPID